MTTEITEDFSAFFLANTSAVEIDLPNGAPMMYPNAATGKRVVAHVYGPSTEQFVKAQDALNRFVSDGIRFRKNGSVKSAADTTAAHEADAKFLVAITDRIDNFPFPGGLIQLFRQRELKYIGDQIRAHVSDLGNFFPGSAKD